MSPNKEGDKLPPFPSLPNMYQSVHPQQQQQVRDEIKDEADFLGPYQSELVDMDCEIFLANGF